MIVNIIERQLRNIQSFYLKSLLWQHAQRGIFSMGDHSYGFPYIAWDKKVTARVVIGKYCSIAINVTIFTGGNHIVQWISTYPGVLLGMEEKIRDGFSSSKGDVIIGNDVWVGKGAVILSGVIIGDGAVIAAYAVVTKNVDPYTIVGGNPAKTIRKRFSDQQIHQLIRIQWWNWSAEQVRAATPLLCSESIDDFIERYGIPDIPQDGPRE